ncbi:MAG: D-alanine--D-alanine ligase [Deltaproteobacteria bacterium]|uniref:D-alanine--D-alanine ligase n=1 Tax=Candidatus Zymogenus saltonus TaxID=2844893 RepID=A0A9D8PQ05_9DELT|nr:D-alanine--D-alanine ligase [Candidatus Zymogenus saltonus]
MDQKTIGIIHNVPISNGKANYKASQDVMVQVDAVKEAIEQLGYKSVTVPFTKDISAFLKDIRNSAVDFIFNLCETVDEDPKLAWQPAAILEYLGIPFSGSSSEAILITTDKLFAKRLLSSSGIKTPEYFIYSGSPAPMPDGFRFPAIVKPRFEDASIGIDQESVFENQFQFKDKIHEFYKRYGQMIVEEYIGGREFNVSVFGYQDPKVLPVAEIVFADYPEKLYKVVTYRAKWEENSFEFQNSARIFPEYIDASLLKRISETALKCFHLFRTRDYARVDMRVDEDENVYVLEINANPCISPDAGLPAACERAGLSYIDMIGKFVDFLASRSERKDEIVETGKKIHKGDLQLSG